jgi:alpha-tubulin suppressor-like RCC1 family protein
VACGLNHTLAVSADGSMVWAFGDGDYGKLGLGNSTAKSSPQVSYALNISFYTTEIRFCLYQYLFYIGNALA